MLILTLFYFLSLHLEVHSNFNENVLRCINYLLCEEMKSIPKMFFIKYLVSIYCHYNS